MKQVLLTCQEKRLPSKVKIANVCRLPLALRCPLVAVSSGHAPVLAHPTTNYDMVMFLSIIEDASSKIDCGRVVGKTNLVEKFALVIVEYNKLKQKRNFKKTAVRKNQETGGSQRSLLLPQCLQGHHHHQVFHPPPSPNCVYHQQPRLLCHPFCM